MPRQFYQRNAAYGKYYQNSVLFLITLFCLLITTTCFANTSNTEAIYVKADEMHFDLQSNTSIYKGNVTIKKGAITLSGNHVEIQQSDNALSSIVITGNPAQFHQTSANGNTMRAESKTIQYFADKDLLVLIENAKLVQNEQIIESNYISYDTKQRALIAGNKSKQPNSAQRVKMTLTPNTKK